MADRRPAIWFPVVRTGTGTDVFTERLVAALHARGFQAEITWLPLRAEYAPWTVPVPTPPQWATICHINTWLHSRFIPRNLPILATLHHSVHDPAFRPYKGWLRSAYHSWWIAPIERHTLRHVDSVVAVSQFVADMARQTLSDVPMQVVHNGIDTNVFHPGSRKRLSNEPFRLLFVGSWIGRKGVDLLAPIMRSLGTGFELHYTGGSDAEKCTNEMPSNMVDLGRLNIEQVVRAMQSADALLFPSRSEGFGLVAAEAMACGLPVIAARGNAIDEVVKDGETGVLVRSGEVSEFAEAARSLQNNVSLHAQMRAAAIRKAVESFSVDRMLSGYIRQYFDLLQ